MEERSGQAKKGCDGQVSTIGKQDSKTIITGKSTGIPNPVKGLKLSLYSMSKQH